MSKSEQYIVSDMKVLKTFAGLAILLQFKASGANRDLLFLLTSFQEPESGAAPTDEKAALNDRIQFLCEILFLAFGCVNQISDL